MKYRVEFVLNEDPGPDELLSRVIELTGDEDASVEQVNEPAALPSRVTREQVVGAMQELTLTDGRSLGIWQLYLPNGNFDVSVRLTQGRGYAWDVYQGAMLVGHGMRYYQVSAEDDAYRAIKQWEGRS